MSEKVIKKCIKSGCVKRRKDRTCLAFIDPKFQWSNGECCGLTDSTQELRKAYDAAYNYRTKAYRNKLSGEKNESKTPRDTKFFIDAIGNCLDLHEEEK